jgi:YidC/Oxa1 family membrane protein insertase
MDKKNMIIGVALLIAAFASMMLTPTAAPPPAAPATATQSTPAATSPATARTYTDTNTIASRSTSSTTEISAIKKDAVGAKVNYLANNFVEIQLSNYGGAIKEVALRKFAETLDSKPRFVLNSEHIDQMLGIVGLPGLGQETAFTIVSQSSREVVYRAVFENRIEVTRRYALADPSRSDTDPYQIRHETTFRNLTDQTLPLPKIALSLGTVSPINDGIYGQQHNSGYFDGEDAHFIE